MSAFYYFNRQVNKMTVKIFSHSQKANTKKAIEWFTKHDVPYELYDLRQRPFLYDYFLKFLYYAEPGHLEFLSTRSKAGIALQQEIDKLTINELYNRIKSNPKLLTEPIMMDETRVLFRYQEIEMTQFLSRSQKLALFEGMSINSL